MSSRVWEVIEDTAGDQRWLQEFNSNVRVGMKGPQDTFQMTADAKVHALW